MNPVALQRRLQPHVAYLTEWSLSKWGEDNILKLQFGKTHNGPHLLDAAGIGIKEINWKAY